MINKSIPFCKFAPENGSGMAREWSGIAPAFPRKLFTILFCLLFIGVGTAWGATYTLAWGSVTSGSNYTNFTANSGSVTNVCSFTTAKNSALNAPAYNATDKELRIYNNKSGTPNYTTDGGQITITPASGVTITGVTITATASYQPTTKYKIGSGSLTALPAWSSNSTSVSGLSVGSSSSITIQNCNTSSKQLRIKTIVITYTATSPTLSVSDNATSLAIGDAKVNGSGETNSTLTFSGSNLSANATLAISGTNASMFTVSPTSVTPSSKTITNQTITVTYTPTSAGSHTATLTISSTGATSKEITLTGTGKYEVIWKNNGGDYTTTLVASGSRPTFPDNPTSCDAGEGASTTFYGWAANGSTWSGKINSLAGKTIYTSAASMPTVSANGTTYHAVFCKGGALTYATSIAANDVVYLATSTESGASGVTGANANGKDATVSTTQADWMPFTVQTNSTGWKLQNGTNYIQATAKNFAFTTSTPNVLTFAQEGSTGKYRMIYNDSSDDYALSKNSSGDYWRFYKTNNSYVWYYVLKASAGTNYMTNCCTSLGSINGSVSWSNAATAVVSWDNLDHVSSWTVKYKTHAAGAYTKWAGDQSTAAGRRSVTIAGLTPCTNYDFQIIANPASGYCDKDQTIEDSQTHNWTVTKTGVTNVTAASLSAIPATTCASGFGPITITAADGYVLPAEITVSGASHTWNQATGALTISSVTGNVSITITPTCVPPVVTGNPADASYYVGGSPDALSVSATLASGTLTYLWKVSTNGGSTWSDATGTNNAATYSGASLSTASAGTLKFKCIVGNSQGGCTVESGVATITVSNASYFPNGKTIFIQAESTSAWTGGGCVKAWFHTSGGSETAQETYWLFDATGGDAGKKLFATVVPASGDLPYLDIQRFASNCSDWWNKNGGCSYADASGSNAIRSTGKHDTDSDGDYVRWNDTGVTLDLHGDPSGDDWASSLASFSDQGAGVWTATYSNYAPANAAGESQDFKAKTNYNGWIGNTGSNNNATLSGMHVGSTYNITATLDVTDHSLEMSKTFVKGTVHFDMQSHGSDISDLTNVAAGSKISAPSPAPTDAAYDFGGWYKEPACTNAWNFASDVVNETMTLYAKWTPHNFTITYEGLAGASNTNPTSYTVVTPTITLVNPGSRTGYTFSGWTLGGSPITQIVLGTTGDKTITANWSINTPNLAVSAADHVVITATPASELAIAEGANRNVNYNKTVTLNCTPDEHWNLVWDVYKTGESSTKVALSGSGDGATFTMPDYGVTVSAVMTEAAYKTVCFKNNGEDIDGYASVKVYVGESPVAPTLTDGTSGDACDPTSDKHYGWTKETWTSTIATQSEIDERTGSEAVYGKSAALPVVAAGDPSTITYHAVWAAGSGSPAITPPTPIVYWAKQSLSTGNSYSATSGSGSLSTNVSMTSNSYPYVYTNTNISSAPVITLSGLNLSGASTSTVSISFFSRGSKASAGPLTVSYYNNSAWTNLATTATVLNGEVAYHEITGIPKTATSVKLTHSASSGSFSIGTIRIFEPNTVEYTFTELDGTNTDGWTNNDWDGYYLITNASTYALDGNGIGEKNFATVSPSDNKIVTTNIGAAFEVTYVSENGYKIQGVGCGDYLNTASNSVAPSASVIYHSSMSYNSVVDNSSNTLKWNSSKFGFYASAGTAIKLFKILSSYSTFLTTCCTQYDISGASTSGTAVTGGTLTSTDNSACEDREVKITANVSDGYRFDSWTITAGGSPVARKDGSAEIEDGNPIYVFDMPAADVTVSATFTRVYSVTYAANGGTGEMIDANSPYAAGDKVTVLTNTFTKAGYNFDSWSYSPAVSVTDGKFDMPSSDVTITAQWTAKPLNNIILAQTEAEIYDQQYVQIDVTYDPADIITTGYTLTGPALTKVVKTGSTQTQLKISATKAGVIISEVVSETVSIKANADETKTASVVVTIKPLPRVHFTDNIHNESFADVVEEIVGNVLSGAKTTPTHSDVSDPGASYNPCERQHLHLLGWIESTWADAHPGATSGEITGAGSSIYYEAGASINVEVQNGKTFYAVWCIVE